MADINLGHVTAYGYAKSKGYTGTEEEFAETMAELADVPTTDGTYKLVCTVDDGTATYTWEVDE